MQRLRLTAVMNLGHITEAFHIIKATLHNCVTSPVAAILEMHLLPLFRAFVSSLCAVGGERALSDGLHISKEALI